MLLPPLGAILQSAAAASKADAIPRFLLLLVLLLLLLPLKLELGLLLPLSL